MKVPTLVVYTVFESTASLAFVHSKYLNVLFTLIWKMNRSALYIQRQKQKKQQQQRQQQQQWFGPQKAEKASTDEKETGKHVSSF